MELKILETEKFEKLPDMSGATYDDIEEFKPSSFIKVENFIREFLDYSNTEKIAKNPPISACMLVASWGLGKTTTYDKTVKKLLKEKKYNGFSIKLRAQDISNYYDTFKDTKDFKNIPGNADRLLYIIAKLLLKNSEFNTLFSKLISNVSESDLIQTILYKIKEKFNFFLIFVDELEEVVRNSNNIIPFILKSIKDLLNGSSNIINNSSYPDLIHFLSFIIACTDAAIYEVSRLEQLEYQYGGIKRRIQEEKINEITLFEAIEYLVKLTKYCYGGRFLNAFVNPGASYNALARMAMKNPGYMKSYFTRLMNKSSTLSASNTMSQIDGKFIIDNSSGFELEYMETQRKSINSEVYNNWFKKFSSNLLVLNLLNLFIGEIKPFSLDEISKRYKKNINTSDINSAISTFNQYIESIHPNIRNAIIPVTLFDYEITRADIENLLRKAGHSIEETEDFNFTIKFKGDISVSLEEFLGSFSYYEVDDIGNVKEKFFFSQDTELLKQIFPYLNSTTISFLRTTFTKIINLKNEYFIINPILFNIIFPLPIPQEYNLLDDKNENVRLWTELSSRKKIEIYNKEINLIVANFLIFKEKILISKNEKFTSETLEIEKIEYFDKEIIDKNRFIILRNYIIKDFSNNPINIMFWRESKDYDNNIITDIASIIGKFQRIEMKNMHLLILISQNKIPDNLLNDLFNNLDYTIIKELNLSQFDITKLTFLNEIQRKFHKKYNKEKFETALTQLISPFDEVIKKSLEEIQEKGLSIKLNNYISKLTDIPQLMKHVLYDLKNDYSNWNEVELSKPFDDLTPIGLSPHYSSSIDDWSNERLRNSVSEYLLLNDFVNIKDNSLIISMPKFEKKLLQLIKTFKNENLELSVEDLKSFFFDISAHQNLLQDVFLTDLENRGIIKINTVKKIEKVSLFEVNELELTSNLKELKSTINTFKIKDKNFYHIYTIKQKGYSLIYLEDFLNILENLLSIKINNEFNEYFLNTRNILFQRIFNVFYKIINCIFVPLDIKLSNFKENLKKEHEEKFRIININTKLKDYGLNNINIENYTEVVNLNQKFSEIINIIDKTVDKKELKKLADQYYKNHKTDVRLSEESFSYLKLQQNKLETNIDSPFLNLLYYNLEEKKNQYFSNKIFNDINKINSLIKKIDENYLNIKGQLTKVSLNDNSKIATAAFNKIKDLSAFKFVKSTKKIENFNDIIEFLNRLDLEITKINIPISNILRRKGRGKAESILDGIYTSEKNIEDSKKYIIIITDYIKEKKIFKDENEINKLVETSTKIVVPEYLDKVQACNNLDELEELTQDISRQLQSYEDVLQSNILNNIYEHTYSYFNTYRDILFIKKLFESLKMEGYAKICESYVSNTKRLLIKDQNIQFKDVCNDLISFKTRIEKGYEEGLKKQLSEDTQKIFVELCERFESKKWFNDDDLNTIIKKFNLSEEKVLKALDDLKNKNLIEKRYYFK